MMIPTWKKKVYYYYKYGIVTEKHAIKYLLGNRHNHNHKITDDHEDWHPQLW